MINLSWNNKGENWENVKYIEEILKNLPDNLKVLRLNLSNNKFGKNS